MKTSERIVWAVGAFTIAVAFYLVFKGSGGDTAQPEFEPPREGGLFEGMASHVGLTMHSGEIQTFGHEWYSHDGSRFLPCRYPRLSGQGITAVIHRGWSALSKPAVADNDWLQRPPGEVQF